MDENREINMFILNHKGTMESPPGQTVLKQTIILYIEWASIGTLSEDSHSSFIEQLC